MKPMWGLIIGACIAVIAIGLRVDNKLNDKYFICMLFFALLTSLNIAYFGSTKKMKAGLDGFAFETFQKNVDSIKQEAIDKLKKEIVIQKEAVSSLIDKADNTSNKLEAQGKSLTELIDKATALQKRIEEQKHEVVKLNLDSQVAKKEIKKLHKASSIIALTLTKATYLTLETKNELGSSPRLEKAKTEILKDINQVLPMVILDPQERQLWIKELQDILPKRQ
ncbi:MAG: hypothetical protein K8R02_08775 [Anaerohalosphaeraceae bacterium]|nr:hypothetical protein [Anaerohalosphaeraceae bacterium]